MHQKAIYLLLLIVGLGVGIGYFFFNRHKAAGEGQGPVVARVGRAVLTEEDIRDRIPPEYTDFITREQNVDYVKRWIDTEILFQTALERRLDKEPEIRNRIRKMQRDLLVSEMISRLSTQTADVSESDIEKYYQDNVDRFTRKETEVQYLHLNVKTLAEAWKVRSQVTPDNFIGLAGKVSSDPVADPATLPYLSRNEIMPELASLIFDVKVGGTTPPIKTPFGFYIVKVVDKKTPGTLKPLESVREEIVNHLSSRTQKIRLDEMIAQMRKNMMVEYYPQMIPGRLPLNGEKADPAMEAENPADSAPEVKPVAAPAKKPLPPARSVKPAAAPAPAAKEPAAPAPAAKAPAAPAPAAKAPAVPAAASPAPAPPPPAVPPAAETPRPAEPSPRPSQAP